MAEGSEAIAYERRAAVAVISLNRPEKRNALDLAAFDALGDAAERAAADPEVRAVLLRAEGPSFCAGIDLGALAALAGAAAQRFPEFVATAQRPYRALARTPKPAVAAVQGHAIGAGFQLALACDLRVVADGATFGLLEGRFGLIPDLGGMWHLAREVGPARTKELAWTARTFGAAEADRMGLVHRLVGPADLERVALAVADELAALSPVTVGLVKDLAGRATDRALDDELEAEAAAQLAALESEDHSEAVAAYLERRPPQFRGR